MFSRDSEKVTCGKHRNHAESATFSLPRKYLIYCNSGSPVGSHDFINEFGLRAYRLPLTKLGVCHSRVHRVLKLQNSRSCTLLFLDRLRVLADHG